MLSRFLEDGKFLFRTAQGTGMALMQNLPLVIRQPSLLIACYRSGLTMAQVFSVMEDMGYNVGQIEYREIHEEPCEDDD